ncbi:uncharacterized protein CC84DRAFT_888378 [Paraphaeosphaeria sporulosa]|uniref:Uncharacterized protein n=1 Tax=Paraphaeosphaeria sporulosa TaxID=1460663 RepID=A0A177CB65_9PLEO|nr:uncharacterized protein CC84DRAFT_888378 [Paraphaeosphaeria sporulosa]OAG04112.1 hypothetical protein CC84DRAFT_888378 [Paraphaeosphaeria sporulosa]
MMDMSSEMARPCWRNRSTLQHQTRHYPEPLPREPPARQQILFRQPRARPDDFGAWLKESFFESSMSLSQRMIVSSFSLTLLLIVNSSGRRTEQDHNLGGTG